MKNKKNIVKSEILNNCGFIKIVNKTSSRIVVNSCNVVLSPRGGTGDSVIVDESKQYDNDVRSLLANKFIVIVHPNDNSHVVVAKKKNNIKSSKKETKSKKSKNKDDNQDPNDCMGGKATYVDRGKIKKRRMVKDVGSCRMVGKDSEDDSEPNNEHEDDVSDAFIPIS